MSNIWPDDAGYAKKPRYSAETGSRLLVESNLDLGNTKNELYKLRQRLDAVIHDRDEISNKLREEMTRVSQLETTLLHRTEELTQERILRENSLVDAESAHERRKQAEQIQRQLEQHLTDISTRQDQGNERNRIEALERRVHALQLENARLTSLPERPPSRSSSIPVPKGRRPRSSSENKTPQLEEDLQVCRAQLVEERAKTKKLEMRVRKAEADATQLQNEKIAEANKLTERLEKLNDALQEAKEETEALRLEMNPRDSRDGNHAQFDALSKQKVGLEEQVKTLKEDKADLEKKLARKVTQCERLQEQLDECFFPSSTEEDLRQEIASLKKELEGRGRDDKHSRRESVTHLKYMLEDRDREVSKLQERLKRRESSTADLAIQEERALRFLKEKEDVKDELAKAQAHSRYVDSQFQFKQQELRHAETQVKELETALSKARSLNAQQQELYAQVAKSCSEAEKRADDVERELSELREEIANRSTASEAAERNAQWAKALDRVAQLEQELASRDSDSCETPRPSAVPLPPVLTFANESEMESVARLVVGLQRIREERDALRGSVEFLSFELQAKENALQRTVESQNRKWIRLLQAAEEDSVALRSELTTCERQLAEARGSVKATVTTLQNRIHQSQVTSLAVLLVLQRVQSQLDTRDTGVQHLEERYSASLREIDELRSSAQLCDRELQASKEKYTDAMQELDKKREALEPLQEQMQKLEMRRDQLQISLDEQMAALKNLEREYTAQTLHIQRLEEANQIAREELYEARIEADQLCNGHLNSFAQEDSEAQSALQRHIEELDHRIIRRNDQIGSQQNEIRRLDMNLRIAENAVEEMRTELAELRSQRVWLESDAQTVRDERNHAQRELDACRNELDTLRTEFENQCTVLKLSDESRDTEIATLVEIISSSALQRRMTVHPLANRRCAEEVIASEEVPIPIEGEQHHSFDMRPATVEQGTQTAASGSTGDETQRQDLEKLLQEATSRGDTLAEHLRRSSEVAREEVAHHTAVLEERIESLSAEVESLEDRLAESQRHLDVVLQQNGELEDQVCALEAEALSATREHEEVIEKNRLQLENAEQSHAQEKQEHLELLERFQELEGRCASAEEMANDVEELTAQLTEQEAAKSGLLDEIAQLKATLEGRTTEIDGLMDRIQELDQLKEDIASTALELAAKQAVQIELEEEISSLREAVNEAESSLNENRAIVERLEAELAVASEHLSSIPQLQTRITTFEATVEKLEAELYEAQQAASAAASTTVRDAEANVRIVELEEAIAKMKADNEELERVLTIKTQEIDEYDDRHIEILKERKKLVTKIDVLNRKIRTMQKQIDSTMGADHLESAPADSATENPAAAPSCFAPNHVSNPAPLSRRTSPQVYTTADSVATKYLPLQPSSSGRLSAVPSSGSRRATASIVPTDTAINVQAMPKSLSSSTPPVPIASAPFILPDTRPTQPQESQVPERLTTTPPSSQSSLNRKRRMPEDFDPAATEHMPAMPVLSTTPGRLRKALREGAPPRTGFTPSRSRKNSATTIHDQELAKVASAAVASLGLAGKLMQENPLVHSASKESSNQSSRPPLNPKSSAELNSTRGIQLSSLAAGMTSHGSKSESAAVPKVRSGWLARANKGTTSSKTTGTTIRRLNRAIDTSPTLGSGVMPKRSLYVPPPLTQDFA